MRFRLSLTVVALLALAVPAADAAAPTRDEYTAQVEPICKKNTKANEQILGSVRQQVTDGKLKAASAKFAKASTALKATLRELRAVPQPLEDKARLGKWLDYVKDEAEGFSAVAKKLKAGQRAEASRLVEGLIRTANRANSAVLPFDFDYCRLEPSRFT